MSQPYTVPYAPSFPYFRSSRELIPPHPAFDYLVLTFHLCAVHSSTSNTTKRNELSAFTLVPRWRIQSKFYFDPTVLSARTLLRYRRANSLVDNVYDFPRSPYLTHGSKIVCVRLSCVTFCSKYLLYAIRVCL
jgi:hypothetical protein